MKYILVTLMVLNGFIANASDIVVELQKDIFFPEDHINFTIVKVQNQQEGEYVFVELIDKNGTIVLSQNYFSKSEIVRVGMQLPKEIEKGNYFISVFTSGMADKGGPLFKKIIVLDPNESRANKKVESMRLKSKRMDLITDGTVKTAFFVTVNRPIANSTITLKEKTKDSYSIQRINDFQFYCSVLQGEGADSTFVQIGNKAGQTNSFLLPGNKSNPGVNMQGNVNNDNRLFLTASGLTNAENTEFVVLKNNGELYKQSLSTSAKLPMVNLNRFPGGLLSIVLRRNGEIVYEGVFDNDVNVNDKTAKTGIRSSVAVGISEPCYINIVKEDNHLLIDNDWQVTSVVTKQNKVKPGVLFAKVKLQETGEYLESGRVSLLFTQSLEVIEKPINKGFAELPFDLSQISEGMFFATAFTNMGKRIGPAEISFISERPDIQYRVANSNSEEVWNYNDTALEVLIHRFNIAKVYSQADKGVKKGMVQNMSDYDENVSLSEYDNLPTMKEVIRELLFNAVTKKVKGVEEIRIKIPGQSSRYDQSPLFLVNNIPTFDSKFILSLEPNDIDHIILANKIENTKYFGILGGKGVIAIYLKRGVGNKVSDATLAYPPKFQEEREVEKAIKNSENPDLNAIIFDSKIESPGMIDIQLRDLKGNYTIREYRFNSSGELKTVSSSLVVE